MRLKSLVMLTAVLALSGCTLPKPITNPTPGSSGITGNWKLTAISSSAGSGSSGTPIGIYLTQTGSTVSGTAWVQVGFPMCIGPNGIPCAFPFGVINPNLAGTIDADGNIVLSSTTGGSAPATFSIKANTTTNPTLSGTYSITLTTPLATASDSGTITGNMIAPLNGTYAGTVVSPTTGLSLGLSITLSQTTTPALYFSSGSANFTGSPCFTTATLESPAATYSGLGGNELWMEFVATNNPATSIEVFGTVSPDAKTLQIEYSVFGGSCNSNNGGGILTLQ